MKCIFYLLNAATYTKGMTLYMLSGTIFKKLSPAEGASTTINKSKFN